MFQINNNDVIFSDIDVDLNHLSELYPQLRTDSQSEYYDVDKLNSIQCDGEFNFRLVCLNIRSLSSNYDEFLTFLQNIKHKFDVICLTESWLTDENCHLYQIDGYNAFHCLRRNGKRGGGISVYVNEFYSVQKLPNLSLSLPSIESLFLTLSYKSKKLNVVTIYKPPLADCLNFVDRLQDLLTRGNMNLSTESYVCGDFNIDLIDYENNNNSLNFLNSLQSMSLVPLITKPTRVTDTTATLIDNIFSSSPLQFTSGVLTCDLSDHFPIFLIRKNLFYEPPTPINNNETYSYRSVTEDSLAELRNNLLQVDFDALMVGKHCDAQIETLYNVIFNEYDKECPIKNKTKSYKSKHKPWITNAILQNMKRRQAYFVLYKQNKLPKVFYNRFRNFVTNQIRNSKIEYYENIFSQYKCNMKSTWKNINRILNPKGSKSNRKDIAGMLVDGDLVTDGTDIANAFNAFFSNVGRKIADSHNSNVNEHLRYLNGDHPRSFAFTPVTASDVNRHILSLKNKNCSLHSLPAKILKSISDILSSPLASIINNSFSTGIFPKLLKQARVTPIHKAGSEIELNNYRPISILHIFSKIFEKVTHSQLANYLERNKILYDNQFGFRSKRSTNQAISRHLQFIYNEIDKNRIPISIFLDFKKAFDCVDHQILLSKLNYYGIRGLTNEWFRSYLYDRIQYTVVGHSSSVPNIVTHGVPQGSILGPLLFLIFINDLPNSSPLFNFTLFADDSTLSASFIDIEVISQQVNAALGNVNSWLRANKLSINAEKTKYIVFSYGGSKILPRIQIGDEEINRTDEIKFLGIIIDEHLTFRAHVNYICSKISKSVGILYKLSKFLPVRILTTLYYTLIHPYISYGIESYFATCGSITDRVVIIQKKAIRAIHNLPYREHTSSYFKSSNILKVEDLFLCRAAVYIHKTINSGHDNTFAAVLTRHSEIHPYQTRHRDKLLLPLFRKSKSQLSMYYTAIKFWNTLPSEICNLQSTRSFQLGVHNQFVNLY